MTQKTQKVTVCGKKVSMSVKEKTLEVLELRKNFRQKAYYTIYRIKYNTQYYDIQLL